MITCRIIGPPEVHMTDGEPPAGLLWRKHLALLVYLALSPRRTRTREHLMGLLWGEKPETAARQSLREAIRILRKALGDEYLVTDGDHVTLKPGAVELDTDRLETLRSEKRWREAATLVGGEFMEGFGVPDASPFEDWLAAERTEWRRRSAELLAGAAQELLKQGRTVEACDTAIRALDLDPGAEFGVRTAMKALALRGARAEALECYERFAQRLRTLNAEPESETSALAERVRREREWQLDEEKVPDLDAPGAESRRAPLIGRDTELSRLVDALSAAAAGRKAAALIVEAAPGAGKSRLLDELASRSRLDGWSVATLRSVPADGDTPWTGVLGLARGGLLRSAGIAAASPGALAAFCAEIPEWSDRFGRLRATPATLNAALADVLRAAAEEQPILLIVDDAHWLDRESMRTLVAVVRDLAAHRFALALAIQQEPQREELDDLRARLGREIDGVAVSLGPLDEEAMAALVAWALPDLDHEKSDRLARRLMVDSAGLPLLAVELLHAVSLGLDLGTIGGTWPEPMKTLDQTLPGDLPDTIVAAIRVGFRRLTPTAQQTLATAAVLGDPVDASVLQHVTTLADRVLFAALDELEWKRWLSADSRGYHFVARVVRDVVARDMITEGQRRRVLEAGGGA